MQDTVFLHQMEGCLVMIWHTGLYQQFNTWSKLTTSQKVA